MMKTALAVLAAAAVLTAPLVTPAKAQGVKMTQVDMQTGRHLDDRDPGYYRERRGTTPTPLLASVHDNAATWGPPRLNSTTAAGSRAGSAAATKAASERSGIVCWRPISTPSTLSCRPSACWSSRPPFGGRAPNSERSTGCGLP
jgi:hypothetical protein